MKIWDEAIFWNTMVHPLWTLLFLRPLAFRKSKMVVCHGNENHRGNGFVSGFVWLFFWLKKVVSKAISSTTRPETEPGRRPIKAGLGVQESGVWGSTKGSKTHRFRYRNGDEWPCRIVPPSVILPGLPTKTLVRNKTV